MATEVTHGHPEAVAGAIAIAIATAYTFRFSEENERPSPQELIECVLPYVPTSVVKYGLHKAQDIDSDDIKFVARKLGNGSHISAMDTVPFTIWSAGKYIEDFQEAFWHTASVGGDVDTTCAIVGGIVAGYVGKDGIPSEWLEHRESLPDWAFYER